MFNLFGHKKKINELKADMQESFNHVKKDFNKIGLWITHLDGKHSSHDDEISKIKDQLLIIQNDLIEVKDFGY